MGFGGWDFKKLRTPTKIKYYEKINFNATGSPIRTTRNNR